jgi:hypothetical protein
MGLAGPKRLDACFADCHRQQQESTQASEHIQSHALYSTPVLMQEYVLR